MRRGHRTVLLACGTLAALTLCSGASETARSEASPVSGCVPWCSSDPRSVPLPEVTPVEPGPVRMPLVQPSEPGPVPMPRAVPRHPAPLPMP